ncbi:MAG: hypothetical protein QOG64_1622 [Acidimicrobiaceae bacterium]|nr:hypothetical protein [Acidimicrobiaceae bacterium]
MLIFLVAAVVGLSLGLARGGSVAGLANVRFSGAPLVWLALVAQALLGSRVGRDLPGPVRMAIVLLSFALVGGFLSRNGLRMRGALGTGIALLALGWGLNTAVVFANGAMPVSRHAIAMSALPASIKVEEGHLWKHRLADHRTHVRALGDVLALPLVPAVFSVGDVSMIVGIAASLAGACWTRPRTRHRGALPAAA